MPLESLPQLFLVPSVPVTLKTVDGVVKAEVTFLQSVKIYLWGRKPRHKQTSGASPALSFFPEASV